MKVIRPFLDKQDNNKPYRVGDSFSHSDSERVTFLIGKGFLKGEIPKEVPIKKSKKKQSKKESK
jgi:hypothetical protein